MVVNESEAPVKNSDCECRKRPIKPTTLQGVLNEKGGM